MGNWWFNFFLLVQGRRQCFGLSDLILMLLFALSPPRLPPQHLFFFVFTGFTARLLKPRCYPHSLFFVLASPSLLLIPSNLIFPSLYLLTVTNYFYVANPEDIYLHSHLSGFFLGGGCHTACGILVP